MRRVLKILQIVSQHGPITLAELCAMCDFSRAAVWRGLDVLRDDGWVRMRLGDNAFEVTASRSSAMAGGHSALSGIEPLAAHLKKMADAFDAHVCLAGFRDGQSLRVLESTNKADYEPHEFSLITEGIALAAQLSLDRVGRLRLLQAYVERCSDFERRQIETGAHAARINELERTGRFVTVEHGEVSCPISLDGLAGYAVRVSSKSSELWQLDSIKRLLMGSPGWTNR